jgi:hypothetical protein
MYDDEYSTGGSESVSDLVDEAMGESPDLEDKLLGTDLDDLLEDGAGPEEGGGGSPNMPLPQEPTYAQPVSRATMVCLRGPCVHYWALTARLVAPGRDVVRLKRIRTCTRSDAEETNLGGQNVYHCTEWWPKWASFVPESMRESLRPALQKAYDKYLVKAGYDLSWKTWPDWLFESDSKQFRKHQAIGAPRPDRRDLEKNLSVETDD